MNLLSTPPRSLESIPKDVQKVMADTGISYEKAMYILHMSKQYVREEHNKAQLKKLKQGEIAAVLWDKEE